MIAIGSLLRRAGTRGSTLRGVACRFADTKTPSFEELLNDGSSQSLDGAAKMLVELETKEKSQQAQMSDLRNKVMQMIDRSVVSARQLRS